MLNSLPRLRLVEWLCLCVIAILVFWFWSTQQRGSVRPDVIVSDPVLEGFYRHLWANSDMVVISVWEIDGIMSRQTNDVVLQGEELRKVAELAPHFELQRAKLDNHAPPLSANVHFAIQGKSMGTVLVEDRTLYFAGAPDKGIVYRDASFWKLLNDCIERHRKEHPEDVRIDNMRSKELPTPDMIPPGWAPGSTDVFQSCH